jgi:hypothetical protein
MTADEEKLAELRRQAGWLHPDEIARRQKLLDQAVKDTFGVGREPSYEGTCNRGPLDSDWHLWRRRQ